MKKRIIMSMMIVVLLLATLIPSSGFAASTTPDWPTLPTGYYGWVKTTSSNGSTAFDELTEAAIKAAITGGIKTWVGVIVAVYDVLEIYSDPGKMYYTFEVYQAFNERGQYMKFSFKKFYKDKDRTKFVTSVQSSVETGTRFSDVENPNTVS